MPTETERKFLVDREKWTAFKAENESHCAVHDIEQGYLSMDPDLSVRVRLDSFQSGSRTIESGTLTIKGKLEGASRKEVSFEMGDTMRGSANKARELLEMCGIFRLKKCRYFYCYPAGGPEWEIDEFESGLILAEIELSRLINQKRIGDGGLILPTFVTKEVTDDPTYYNVNLVRSAPPSQP